ncbi:MAG: response regulator [Candidatus Tantalella remota]|nr:response regulator [Candidatus Tantalella remota]
MSKKILIIEDEYDTAKVLARRMTDNGFDVVMAYDSESGKHLVVKESPDLILLDLMLPPDGGESVLAQIRMNEASKDIPVVVLTGIEDDECKRMIGKMGVSAYLTKPYNSDELRDLVNKALGN